MLPVSVFIITKNEKKNLPRCLEEIKGLADEIIVLDSGSTDQTESISKKYGAKFSVRTFDGFGQQKYAAEQLCKNDWVLNLDADEFVTEKLKTEIRGFLSGDLCQKYDGARLKTVGVYPHHTSPRPLADYHNYIRLYNKTVLHFPQHPTHDAVIARDESRIYQFSGIALHYAFESLDALEQKARSRTKFYFEHEKRGKFLKNLIRLPFEYLWSFFKCYILRRQFTGGRYGLKNAMIYAKYRHLRIAQRVFNRCFIKE